MRRDGGKRARRPRPARDSRALWLAVFRLTRNRLEDGDRHRLNRRHSGNFSHRDRVRYTDRASRQRDRVLKSRAGALAHDADCPTLALDRLCHHFRAGRRRHSRSIRLSERGRIRLSERGGIGIWPRYRRRGEDADTEKRSDDEYDCDPLFDSPEAPLVSVLVKTSEQRIDDPVDGVAQRSSPTSRQSSPTIASPC